MGCLYSDRGKTVDKNVTAIHSDVRIWYFTEVQATKPEVWGVFAHRRVSKAFSGGLKTKLEL